MDMGALLDLEAAQSGGGQLRRGEIIEGMVMGASPDGLIVDVGTKMEAVIPHNEMLSLGVDGASRLKAGDTVRVMVLQPSTAEGHAIVSLDRARGEEGWETLQKRFESGEIFEAQVTGHNRGGLLVNVDGVNAFVPLSQVESVRRDDPDAANQLAGLVGQVIKLKVVELNRKRNRVILSERAAMAEIRKEQKDRVLEELQEGQIRTGRVSSITDFGVFIDLGGADGLAHMTELTWERGKKAKDLFQVGDEVQAYILKVDRENKKISLSLKRAQPERWDTTVDRFVIGQILIGRVTKLMPFGAFVRLEGPVEGLIHISELSNRRISTRRKSSRKATLCRSSWSASKRTATASASASDRPAATPKPWASSSTPTVPSSITRTTCASSSACPPRDTTAQPARREPRTAQEAIEQAVARDPEPMSAFAAAFAQALENAEAGNGIAETVAQVAGLAPKDQAPAPAEAPAAEPPAPAEAAESPAEAAPAAEPVAEAAPPAEAPAAAEETAQAAPAAEARAAADSGIGDAETRVSTGETAPDQMPHNNGEGSETAPAEAPAATEEETADGS
ncbi:MAG: hypothetical protein KatS3mg064_1847 [Tepidiforma sp.]|nr:S1 RNA-binding domain-containing protein [Tepidiforma sp.]GIW18690.1 MAG: hypothetical protein KatS3mg064_1847 [Tepidiforma sp.]